MRLYTSWLILNSEPWAMPRFRFEAIWTKFDGFIDVVHQAWLIQDPRVDACISLDIKLRAVVKALKS
jgi:hypothetical protein